MWDWFINFLTAVLAGIQGFVGDWGLAIIVLTVIVRLALTPLQTKSVKSTAGMQVMQPRIQEIQEKYGFPVASIVSMAEVVECLYNKECQGKVVIDDTLKAAIDTYYEQYGAK